MKYLLAITTFTVISIIATGTETVKNGRTPSGKHVKIVLTEDLRISPEDREDVFIWSGPNVAVAANNKGHMFVTDDAENRIVEIDPDGKLVAVHGGTGQAPGEFQALRSFQILADGSAIAFDSISFVSIITRYDASLNYLDRRNLTDLNVVPRNVSYSHDGRWIASLTTVMDNTRGVEITRYTIFDKDFKEQKELLYWETPSLNPQKVNDPNHWAEFLGYRLGVISKGHNAFAAFSADGHVYTAHATKYEITKWSPDLKNKLLVFTREYEPIPQTEEEVEAIVSPIRESLLSQLPSRLQSIITPSLIRRAVALAEFPPVKFPIAGLTVMEDGKLMVLHNNNNDTREGIADIFEADGKYIGSFKHPDNGLNQMIFKNGFAYAIETDEDQENHLVRYKIGMTDS